MEIPTQTPQTIPVLGVDDFPFRRGRTFGMVLVDLETHQICNVLPNRLVETVAAWMRSHPEITIVSRDRGSEYASAASQGAPQAVQVADRFHIAKNMTEAVQNLLARVLPEMKGYGQEKDVSELTKATVSLPIEELRPAQEASVKQTVATRRAERQDRYQHVMILSEQKMTSQEIANHLGMKAQTVRDWLHKEVAPDTRPRRKQQSDFDQHAPYVLKRWRQGEHNGRPLWREITPQGFRGSERMGYRFLETLKNTDILFSAGHSRLPYYTSNTAVWLFVRILRHSMKLRGKISMPFA
ncbi:hypothetical protein KDA_74110 [Dictyobacter alpinus]|uniref:Transposase IS204/IS1001/IS1096/IS1165 DDE domain-containing protein n=2 Tax=Dictyobacter alpinus TaxID=2014873 RepID=A0A402BKN3_9CHLR|nr:hypothetical protein KDA_74110 [Dictyobacter alpinus]